MPKPICTFEEFKKLSRDERGYFIYDEITDANKHLKKLNGTVGRHEKIIWILTGVMITLSIVYGQEGIIQVFAFFL